jgi:hypothetical protein
MQTRAGRSRAIAVAFVCLAALAAGGCMAKQAKTPVYDKNNVQVFLRQSVKGDKAQDRGYSHPVTISPVRITNILARIEVRVEDEDEEKSLRKPAVPTGVLYSIGEGVSQALAKADSSQEVVVMAIERRKSLKVFTQDFLTSAILWVKDDRLFVHLGDMGTIVSTDARDKPREPQLDTVVGKKKVIGGEGITPSGPRIVAVDWRNNVFKDLSAIRVQPGGKVVRRTILVEEPAEDEAATAPGPAPPPEGLSPEALRALADLEEVRRRGELSETDYQAKRREILSGKVPAP